MARTHPHNAWTKRREARTPVNGIAIALWVVAVSIGLAALVWLGLQIPARPYPDLPLSASQSASVALPTDLPDPVARFYRRVYGEQAPVVDTAVVTGRAQLRIMGLTLPARFRFVHEAGHNYRHFIDVTFFGLPVMTVDEAFIEGSARMTLPFGTVEGEPRIDQAANLGLWAEAIWFPSIWLMDERVRWEPVDATTALLVVPNGDQSERFIARFDPETDLLWLFESMRYREADSIQKSLWINEVLEWSDLGSRLVAVRSALTWLEDGTPWARWTVERVDYNVEVGDLIRADP